MKTVKPNKILILYETDSKLDKLMPFILTGLTIIALILVVIK